MLVNSDHNLLCATMNVKWKRDKTVIQHRDIQKKLSNDTNKKLKQPNPKNYAKENRNCKRRNI